MSAQTAADRGRDVRQRLLCAATELIPQLGWTAVSTRLLAERAGVAPGLVHYHFQSVQALLREAALSAMRHVVSATQAMFRDAETLDDGLDIMLGSLDAYTGRDATSALFTEAFLAATRDHVLRDALGDLLTDFRRDLATWLDARGQDMPDETACVLTAALDGMMLHRALNPDLTAAVAVPVLRRVLHAADSGGATREKD